VLNYVKYVLFAALYNHRFTDVYYTTNSINQGQIMVKKKLSVAIKNIKHKIKCFDCKMKNGQHSILFRELTRRKQIRKLCKICKP